MVARDRRPLTECEAFLLRFARKSPGREALRLVNGVSVCDNHRIYIKAGIRGLMRVSGHRISVADFVAGRFWHVAALTTAGLIGSASHADAALYYWQDNDPGFYRPAQPMPQRRHRARRSIDKKAVAAEKDTGAKPVGPLIISISIEKQRVRVYDANGFFAEAPVSTGMKGHPTPMGVFSIIQKHKLHHSNIYSGAPMPYMQRITWSGVAMHAGVLPGYPASHGCIRMPMNFAVKMWGWTRIGARVVITPGERTPESFSHPLLATQKTAPLAAAEAQKNVAVVTAKSDRVVAAPIFSEARLELKSTVGHALAKPVPGTHTADASGVLSQPRSPLTIIDAPV